MKTAQSTPFCDYLHILTDYILYTLLQLASLLGPHTSPFLKNVVSVVLLRQDCLKFLAFDGCFIVTVFVLLKAWVFVCQDSWSPSSILTNLSGLWVKLGCY